MLRGSRSARFRRRNTHTTSSSTAITIGVITPHSTSQPGIARPTTRSGSTRNTVTMYASGNHRRFAAAPPRNLRWLYDLKLTQCAARALDANVRRRRMLDLPAECIREFARCDLRVFHDNATAESRHRKGSSPHVGECRLLALTHRRMVSAGMTMRTTLVPSDNMVADRDSRCPA